MDDGPENAKFNQLFKQNAEYEAGIVDLKKEALEKYKSKQII